MTYNINSLVGIQAKDCTRNLYEHLMTLAMHVEEAYHGLKHGTERICCSDLFTLHHCCTLFKLFAVVVRVQAASQRQFGIKDHEQCRSVLKLHYKQWKVLFLFQNA